MVEGHTPFDRMPLDGKDIAVVIPALNEALRIRGVVEGALAHCPRVIVVDDGSDDETAARIADLPVTLLQHPVRMGKGASLRDGFREALRQGAHVARRQVVHDQVARGVGVQVEVGAGGSGVELAHLGVDDVVDAFHERPAIGAVGEEGGIQFGQHRDRVLPEPAKNLVSVQRQRLHGRGDQRLDFLVRVVAQ